MQSFACQARPSRELHPFTAMLFFRFFSYLHINHNGPAEVGLIQVGIFQVNPIHDSPKEIGPAQGSTAQVGIAQGSLAEVCPAKVRSTHVGLGEFGETQIRSTHVGLGQVRSCQDSCRKRCSTQVRSAKVRLAEDSSIKVEIGEINAFEIHPAQVQPAGFSCFAMDAVNIPSGKRYFHLPGGRAITGTPHNHPPFASKSKSKLLLRQLSDGCTSSGRKTKTCFASSKPLLYCRLCQDISNGIWLRRNCSHFLL